MYPNLLTNSMARNLEAKADHVWLINTYNDLNNYFKWPTPKRRRGEIGWGWGCPAYTCCTVYTSILGAPTLVVPSVPPIPHETQLSPRLDWHILSTKYRESRQRSLQLLQAPTSVLAHDGGYYKRGTIGQDGRMRKAQRINFVDKAAGSSTIGNMAMQDAMKQETWREPQRLETPI